MKKIENKFQNLKKILLELKSVLLAYSGGVDSTFLLYVAKETLGNNLLVVTATSPTYTKEEIEFAKNIAKELGVRHIIIETYEFNDKSFVENPPNRCYYCKKELFSKLKEIKEKEKLHWIIDATNYDDRKDYRPGNLAKKEFEVISPLALAKFTKDDIRYFSKKFGLPTYDKPSLACLASRIPYGEKITKDKLNKIYKSEKFIRNLGFSQVRVRHHNSIARIEVEEDEIEKLLKREIRKKIIRRLGNYGFDYITFDLQGYKTGSMNKMLDKE